MKFSGPVSSMKAMVYKLFLIGLILFVKPCSQVFAQDSLRRAATSRKTALKISTPSFDRRVLVIDSLSERILEMESREDSLFQTVRILNNQLTESKSELTAAAVKYEELKLQLEDAQGDKLQSSHTNSILFIFNVGVGIFLLIALLWMFMKRKNEGELNENNAFSVPKRQRQEDENFDHKLDRIQKLGTLRDKGLLTDDEFNLQKKQILGE